jgi:hypothetical protein
VIPSLLFFDELCDDLHEGKLCQNLPMKNPAGRVLFTIWRTTLFSVDATISRPKDSRPKISRPTLWIKAANFIKQNKHKKTGC